MYYFGFDIGGTNIKAVLVNNDEIIKSKSENLPVDLDSLLSLVSKIFKELASGLRPEEIGGVGFSLAGALDVERKEMLKSPNIPYLDGQPIKELFARTLNPYSVKIEHDVHCFLLAEARIGLAKKLNNVFYLTVGTGVGGAFMIERRIFRGVHGAAGEAGHMIINQRAGLGLEDLSSNKFFQKELGLSAQDAEKLVRGGDKKATEIFDQRCYNLGVGLANIINIFDPEAIILGGGITAAKDLIETKINAAIKQFVVSPAAKQTPVLFSELGAEGGALGAAFLFAKNQID